MSTNKFNLFLENARLLSDKFGIVPLLYGSLGLEYLTGDALGVCHMRSLYDDRCRRTICPASDRVAHDGIQRG